jgi:hypothetical protein
MRYFLFSIYPLDQGGKTEKALLSLEDQGAEYPRENGKGPRE